MKWNQGDFQNIKCTHNISFLQSFHVCLQTAHALRGKFTSPTLVHQFSVSSSTPATPICQSFSRHTLLFHIQFPPLHCGFLRQWLVLTVFVFFQGCRMPHSLSLRLLDSIQGLQLFQFSSISYCRLRSHMCRLKHGGNARLWIKCTTFQKRNLNVYF